jgi:hypothetical protein
MLRPRQPGVLEFWLRARGDVGTRNLLPAVLIGDVRNSPFRRWLLQGLLAPTRLDSCCRERKNDQQHRTRLATRYHTGVARTIHETEGMRENDALKIDTQIGIKVFLSDDAKEGPLAFRRSAPRTSRCADAYFSSHVIARKSSRHSESNSSRACFSALTEPPCGPAPLFCTFAAISRIVRRPSTCWT